MFSSHFTEYNKSRLHYMKAGSGNDAMIFFHGFGQDHAVYIPIIQTLSRDYTLYIFDLYFHGKSTWADNDTPLEKMYWKEIMKHFMQEQKIKSFSLTAFSLGGKFALATLEAFPLMCKAIFLIAPDGIARSFWYEAATYPFFTRALFKSLIDKPHRFDSVMRFLGKFKYIDRTLLRFADYQMNTAEKRRRVYYSWVVFRHLSFNHKALANLINEKHIETTIVIGKYDPVIPLHPIQKFISRIANARLHVLEAGHTGLLRRDIFQIILSDAGI